MERDVDRRTFLKRSAMVPMGFAGLAAQDEPSRPRVTRRMVFEDPAKLSDDYVGRIVLLTDRMPDTEPEMSGADACGFTNWPPEELMLWEGLVIEWQNEEFGDILTAEPEVRAERMAELRILVDEQDDHVELGTAFIAQGRVECPGDYVGITANEVPGIEIRTPPDLDVQG